MRGLAMMAVLGFLAAGASAQDADTPVDKCAQTEAWFMMAVDARLAGDTLRKVRRTLTQEMGKTAAEQLADFVFALPEAQLTPEVGKLARAQCEAL
ncbi:hypothetical protein [Maliponia aquimaris]|uniref:Uncharacterized protein n=1 Tax=Maliponia aquimaris TaxID=1673631 RepID=A0A238KXS1_9RHOB|nr:hypothetical protein [Maliponia aquimaris]SMX47589.1 hypothetical protein MAA8898_03698 [Maliponia aquimaris]